MAMLFLCRGPPWTNIQHPTNVQMFQTSGRSTSLAPSSLSDPRFPPNSGPFVSSSPLTLATSYVVDKPYEYATNIFTTLSRATEEGPDDRHEIQTAEVTFMENSEDYPRGPWDIQKTARR